MSFFKRFGGYLLAAATIIMALSGTYLGQRLMLKYDLNNPYLLTYFNTSWLLLLGIFSFISFAIRRQNKNRHQYIPIPQKLTEVIEEKYIPSTGNIFQRLISIDPIPSLGLKMNNCKK